jgi:hypothetical protein
VSEEQLTNRAPTAKAAGALRRPNDDRPNDDRPNDDRPTDDPPHDRLHDDDYPAYTMGRAAEMIGVTAAFLRSLGEARLLEPQRSTGGHRRYSRHQLRLATRARELVDEGLPLLAACRIVTLEDRLDAAHRRIAELERR